MIFRTLFRKRTIARVGQREHHRLLIQPLSMRVSTGYDSSARCPLMRSDVAMGSTLRHHLNPSMYVNNEGGGCFKFTSVNGNEQTMLKLNLLIYFYFLKGC